MRHLLAIISLMSVASFGSANVGGDAENGEALFQQCSGCHEVGQGARDRIGPHLNNIFDRPAGAAEGYRYSTGFERAAAGGLSVEEQDAIFNKTAVRVYRLT